jgi:hypothetical protein
VSISRLRRLLAPGNEDEWARINEEKERWEAELATSLSTSARLEFGQELCDQAFGFHNAIHGPSEFRKPVIGDVIADAVAASLPHVVIGGFAVIAHGCLRATKDSNLLIPSEASMDWPVLHMFDRVGATSVYGGKKLAADDVAGAHHLRVNSRHGIIDIMRGGLPPLDYETAAERAVEVDVGGTPTPFASLLTLVGFKRLADRGQDRLDLENLERVNGELPIEPIPGLDT